MKISSALLTTVFVGMSSLACTSSVDDQDADDQTEMSKPAEAEEAKPANGFSYVSTYTCPTLFPYQRCNGYGQCSCNAYPN